MNDETGKFTVEEVDAAPAKPERPQVDPRADRRPDYLEGFLTQKAEALTGNEPGGELYEAVITALKEIYDPEIPVNIYDLGLIYGLEIDDDAHAVVTMTLTTPHRSEEHTSELQSLMRISYAVFCSKKKTNT